MELKYEQYGVTIEPETIDIEKAVTKLATRYVFDEMKRTGKNIDKEQVKDFVKVFLKEFDILDVMCGCLEDDLKDEFESQAEEIVETNEACEFETQAIHEKLWRQML